MDKSSSPTDTTHFMEIFSIPFYHVRYAVLTADNDELSGLREKILDLRDLLPEECDQDGESSPYYFVDQKSLTCLVWINQRIAHPDTEKFQPLELYCQFPHSLNSIRQLIVKGKANHNDLLSVVSEIYTLVNSSKLSIQYAASNLLDLLLLEYVYTNPYLISRIMALIPIETPISVGDDRSKLWEITIAQIMNYLHEK